MNPGDTGRFIPPAFPLSPIREFSSININLFDLRILHQFYVASKQLIVLLVRSSRTAHSRNIRKYFGTWRAGASEEEIRAGIEKRIAFDKDALLDDQLLWLREAGFTDVDGVYRNSEMGLFLGVKGSLK